LKESSKENKVKTNQTPKNETEQKRKKLRKETGKKDKHRRPKQEQQQELQSLLTLAPNFERTLMDSSIIFYPNSSIRANGLSIFLHLSFAVILG